MYGLCKIHITFECYMVFLIYLTPILLSLNIPKILYLCPDCCLPINLKPVISMYWISLHIFRLSLSRTQMQTASQTANLLLTHGVCVWDCFCLTGIWVHAAVRRCARTWWSTTSWLLWQHCLERWDSSAAFSSPHHFSFSSSAAVTARHDILSN